MIIIRELDMYKDDRGYLSSIWKCQNPYDLNGTLIDDEYLEDRISKSCRGSIRGFHSTPDTNKLCICLVGSIRFVIFDPKTRKKFDFVLNDDNLKSIYVSQGHLIAHQVLSDFAVLLYKWDRPYDGPENQISVAWNDPEINVKWDILPPILSDRDKNAKTLKEQGL